MFKLAPASFKATIGLSVPGEAAPVDVTIEYRALPRDEMTKYIDSLKDSSDLDALATIVIGWEGMDAPFSKDNLAVLVSNYPLASREIFDGFQREYFEAKRKN